MVAFNYFIHTAQNEKTFVGYISQIIANTQK